MPNKHFQESLRDFLTYMITEKGYGKNTEITYRRILNKFTGYLIVEEISFSKVNSEIFTKYIRSLNGLCANSIRLVIEACRAFFKFLEREGIIQGNPVLLLASPTVWKKIPDILSVTEIELIIDSLSMDSERGAIYRSIIELMYGSGLRVSEVCNLRISDIQNGMILVRSGKGCRDRVVPHSEVFFDTISEYWRRYRYPFPKHKDLAFINPRNGLQLNRLQIFGYIKRICRNCNIIKNISPHSFRHAFATHLIINGADMRVVQEMLGHSSIKSTSIYLHFSLDDIKSSFQKAHQRFSFAS